MKFVNQILKLYVEVKKAAINILVKREEVLVPTLVLVFILKKILEKVLVMDE